MQAHTVAIKITIDNRDIRNPVAKVIVGLIGVAILAIVLLAVFLLLLPFVWFAVLAIFVVTLGLLALMPAILTQQNRDQGHVIRPRLREKKRE